MRTTTRQRFASVPRLLGPAVLLAAAAIAAATIGTGVGVRPVQALDLCGSMYCADIEIWPGGAGSGRVTSDPYGIDCIWNGSTRSGTCRDTFAWGYFSSTTTVDITYQADADNYVCIGSGDCSGLGGSRGETITLSPGSTVARSPGFYPAKHVTYTVTPTGDGAGRVTSNPSGLDCRRANGTTSGTCTKDFAYAGFGVEVHLTFQPDPESYFCNDQGDCTGVGVAQGVSIGTSGSNVQWPADFRLGHPIVTVSRAGSGSVASSPAGISCGSDCSSYFPSGTALKLTASPASGWSFAGWTGACGGVTSKACTLNLASGDVTTAALFTKNATPAPTVAPTVAPTARPTPRPTATPRAAATAAPPSAPAATPAPVQTAAAGSGAPPATGGPTAPATTAGPGDPGATTGPGPVTSSTDAPQPDASPLPVGAIGGTSGPDTVLLVLIVVLASALGLVLGGILVFWLTRRTRRAKTAP